MDVESNISADKSVNLQSALSALSSETENLKCLQNIKTCMKFISTFSISDVEKELLQWVMPALRNTIQKAFDDNFLLSDTCEDEFVLNILGENLKLILQLLEIVKEILEFIIENSKILLCEVKNVAIISVQVISATFDHCRKSSEPLKKHFNEDLLNIFKIMQSIHPLYFELLEHCELVADVLENQADIDVLLEVLDKLCTISENLRFLNIKSLAINWKGFLSIAQNFSGALKDQVDLKRPIAYLTTVICDYLSLSSAKDPDAVELSTTQTIQFSGFLAKVVLKLYGIFWENRRKFENDIMEFCCIIYSFTPNKFVMMEYPADISKLVDDTIFVHLKPFILTLFVDDLFPQVVANKTFLSDKYRFGFLNILNTCLEFVIINEDGGKCQLDTLVELIFSCVKICHEEFFWSDNVFDDLVVNISAAVMTHDRCYKKVEIILLKNILQEEIVSYFLATEIWCLLLRNSSPAFCADTVTNLIKTYSQLDFGNNTHRLERFYLLSLIQRIVRILPDYLKCKLDEIVWKKIGFKNLPKQMNPIIEGIYTETLEKVDKLHRDDFKCKDLVILVENFKCLSTVNYKDMNIPHTNLLNAIENIWKLEFNDTTNNLFIYFITSVCKITSNFLSEFNNKQLYTLLNRLTHLSSIDCLKIHICLIFKRFCNINDNQLGQDGCRIYKIFSNILSNLLLTSNGIIKQYVLEILEILTQNGKYDVVRDVLNGCSSDINLQGIISDFLRKKSNKIPLNGSYFKNLGTGELKHACVEWKREENFTCKKIKLDKDNHNELPKQKLNIEREKTGNDSIKVQLSRFQYNQRCNPREKEKPTEESEKSEDDNIDEVLSRIKGEVKCLLKVLKTDKLSTKNSSDIKIITNQLMSLM